jgi:hypothetical protein
MLARYTETVRTQDVRTDGDYKDGCQQSGDQERDPDREGLVSIGGIDGQREERNDDDDAKEEAAAFKNWKAHAAWS